jgi:hypothetical protein
MSLLHYFMAQGLCLVSTVILGMLVFSIDLFIGCIFSFWYGYYKLGTFIVVLIVGNFIYLVFNFEKIASY